MSLLKCPILPFQVREGFASVENLEEKPMAEIVLCAGFFLIYVIEEVVHGACDPKDEDDGPNQRVAVQRCAMS